jgi:KaiC/GvpD/RAD55 family RecA-like ATPase
MAAKKEALLEEIEQLEKQIKQVKSSLEDIVKVVRTGSEDRVKTYIKGFDEELDGGIQNKHIVLISGTSGTLKSSLALSILYNNTKNRGIKGLYLSLEESKESLVKTLEGLNMNDISEKELMIVDIGRMRAEHMEVNSHKDWFKIIEKYLEKKVKTDEISLLVLDSLTALSSFSKSENLRNDIFYFFNFLKKLGLTSFIISESNLEINNGSPARSIEENLSDGVINLRFYEANGSVELRIRCVKLRHSNHNTNYFILSQSDSGFLIAPINNDGCE